MISLPFPADVIERLGWVLVHSLWQFAAIAIAALVLEHALRGRTATVRYAVLLFALAAMAAAPVVTWVALQETFSAPVIAREAPIPTVARAAERTAIDPGPGTAELPAAPSDPQMTNIDAAAPAPEESLFEQVRNWGSAAAVRLRPWLAHVVTLWLAGVACFSLRPIVSWRTVRRLRTTGTGPVPETLQKTLERTVRRLHLKRAVQVLQSTLVHAPVVVGHFRPLVLLPVSAATGLTPSQWEAVLAHELAHIRRHDYLANLAQTIVETVFFYHPAVWWLSARIRQERENCCDDLAAAALGDRVVYGRALLALAELRGACPTLAMGARGGSFLYRIRRLLEREPAKPALGAGSIAGFALLAGAIVAAMVWTETLTAVGPDQNDSKSEGGANVPSEDKPPQAGNARQPDAAVPPKLMHIPGHERSAVAWQAGEKVHFVLYAQGFLQTGLEQSFAQEGKWWQVRGHLNLLMDRRPVRRFEIRLSSAEPHTLYLDGKAYAMGAFAKPNSTDGVLRSGRLFVLREKGDPLQTDRTLPLKENDKLDPKDTGSLAFSAERDLHYAETYAGSIELASREGWVIAWDTEHPIQHSDGARMARLRVFPDGRVAAWKGLRETLVETRIPKEEVTDLVDWLIDEQGAGARKPMKIKREDGTTIEADLDPLLGPLWDQEAERVAIQRGGKTYDLMSITPSRADRPEPTFPQSAGSLSDEVRQRLAKLVELAAAGDKAAPPEDAKKSEAAAETEDAAALIRGAVLDEAGEPIPKVRVLAGVPFKGASHPTAVWQPHTIREFTGGRFAWPEKNAYPALKLRIEADGYETFTTDWFIKSEGAQSLDAKLKRDPGIELTVFTSEGKPAAGADVAVAMSNRTVRLNGRIIEGADQPPPEKISDQWRRPVVGKTGADGKIKLRTERDPTATLSIVHESGYFERPFGAYLIVAGKPLEPRTIKLQAWGRIEGEVRWKDRPGAYETVQMIIMRDAADYPVIESSMIEARCDEQGRFRIDDVPPGQVQLLHVAGEGENRYFHAHVHPVVEPGTATRVVVGGNGRIVRGAIAGFDKDDGLMVRIAPNAPRPGDLEIMAAFGAFAKSELGKLYFREPVAVNADGTFQIEDVLPGYYQVFIQSRDRSIFAVPKLSVPAEAAGEAPQPLDMGRITVTRRPAN